MKSKDTWCLIENYVLKNNLRIYSYLSILVFSQSADDDHSSFSPDNGNNGQIKQPGKSDAQEKIGLTGDKFIDTST